MKLKTNVLQDKLDSVIWILAIPLILTNLIDSIYGLIDSWFVSGVGKSAVASVAFVGPIQDVATSLGTGVSIAGCSLIARYIGASDSTNAKKMTGQLITIGFGMGLLASGFFFLFSDEVLVNAGLSAADPDPEKAALWDDASIYLKISSWSVAFNFITVICLAIERARGNTKQAVPINMSSLVFKIFFTWLFTMPLDYGLKGIAFATVLAKAVSAGICVVLLIVNKGDDSVDLKNMLLDFGMIRILLVTAVPLALEKSLVSYGFVVVNEYVLAVPETGADVLTAYGLTNKVNTVFFKTAASFGTALSVIVAQHVGAGDFERAEKAVKRSMFFAVAVACGSMVLLLPNKEFVAGLFLTPTIPDPLNPDVMIDNQAYYSMLNAMSIYSAAVIPWAITETAQGVFQGTGKTIYNLMISMVRIYVLRIPVVWFFALPELGLGEYGIWYAMLISNILAAVFSYSLYLFHKKKLFSPEKEGELPEIGGLNSESEERDSE